MHKVMIFILAALMVMAVTPNVEAQIPASSATTAATGVAAGSQCTTFQERAKTGFGTPSTTATTSNGILTDIYKFVTETVDDSLKALYTAVIEDSGYADAVFWAMTLMVLFYGIGFTIGIVQPSFQQVLVRLVKMGFILAMIAPGGAGWDFFNNYVVNFFEAGTDEIIRDVQSIGFGYDIPANATPFYGLDRLATFLIQPDTIVGVLGTIFSHGPFGFGMGSLLLIALWGFFSLVIDALRTYAVCYVARALILALGPIFIVFLLFEKTKNIFIGWVNALINLSLQPILLFTFLSFFLVMMESAATDMLNVRLCWDASSTSVEGTVNKMNFWSFSPPMTGDWNGAIECQVTRQAALLKGDTSAASSACAPFPINIVDMLCFLILVWIAKRFSKVVERISQELSNAFINLDAAGKMDVEKLNNQAGNAVGSNPKGAAGQPPTVKRS